MEDKTNFLDELIEKLNKGIIDRRNFLKLAGAAGLTVCAAVSGAKNINAKPGNSCLSCHGQAPANFVVDPNTQALIDRAHSLGIDLVWDRGALCTFSHKGQGGVTGTCCFRCQMGPCTLGPATGKDRGACGATIDLIVARGLVRRIAGGTAAHVEHARAAAEVLRGVGDGTIPDYTIKDPAKLDAIYAGLGCTGLNKAVAVAEKTLEDLNSVEGTPAWLNYKANADRKGTWGGLGILPKSAGAALSETLHRTNMGVDGDMTHLALHGLKLGLVDGYCGLHAATGIQDVLFGTPMAVFSKAGLSVIEADKINIVIHGHEPILSEKIVDAAAAYNAAHPLDTQVNVVGICCTGNEVLMRKGVKAAGSMVQAELAIATGAVEAMVVDVQCIIPNVQRVAEQFHTKIITTNPHAQITGATHIPFDPADADNIANDIIVIAIQNRNARVQSKVFIPTDPPKDIVAGFSVEQIVGALAAVNPTNPLKPLIDNIAANNIRGIVGIVGCVTPRDDYGYRHITLTNRLLAENILVVGTGCWAHVAGQYGRLAADPAYPGVGAGLKAVLEAVKDAVNNATGSNLPALPSCWHMGSCVDNSRIEDVLNAVAGYLGVNISQLPVAASAPEFITEKAVSIGTWAVDLGLLTHIGGQPYVSGSETMVKLLTGQALPGLAKGVETLTGGKFYVENDPEVAATTIINHINEKRQGLGLGI